MTGKELYELYREEHKRLGCLTETFEDLEEDDQEVWEAVAARVYDISLKEYVAPANYHDHN